MSDGATKKKSISLGESKVRTQAQKQRSLKDCDDEDSNSSNVDDQTDLPDDISGPSVAATGLTASSQSPDTDKATRSPATETANIAEQRSERGGMDRSKWTSGGVQSSQNLLASRTSDAAAETSTASSSPIKNFSNNQKPTIGDIFDRAGWETISWVSAPPADAELDLFDDPNNRWKNITRGPKSNEPPKNSPFGSAPAATQSNSPFGNSSAANPAASQPNTSTSLFGNSTAGGGGGSGSPFGNAQSNQPASNSLFAGPGQSSSQPSSNSGLFGGGSAQTSAPSGGNLFGGLGGPSVTSQPQSSGGLFGTLGGSTLSSQPQAGGLSSRVNQPASTPQTQPAGLFGGTNPTSQPMGGSMFGATAQGSRPGLGTTATSGPSAEQNLVQNGQAVKADVVPQAALFEDILARGKRRHDGGTSSTQTGTLPSLQLGLGDISTKIKGLGASKPNFSASRANDSRAQYLLAASGVPQGATRKDLDAFVTQSGSAASQIPSEFDPHIDNYVANLHAKTTRELMDEAMEQSKRDFDNFLEENLQIDWDYQRQRVYQHLGLVKPDEQENLPGGQASSLNPAARGAFGRSSRRTRGADVSGKGSLRGSMAQSGLSKSVLGGSIARGSTKQNLFKDVDEKAGERGLASATDNPFQRTKQERYAGKVKELNIARIEDVVYPVIEQFARVELDGGSDTPKHLIDSYHALRCIVQEKSDVERPSDAGAVRERQYATEYLNEASRASSNIRMRQQILQGSLTFLENSFFAKVEEAVDRNPQEANIGGMPTKASRVRGYLRIREAARDLLEEEQEPQRGEDGEPIWAMIYFLIRSGLVEEVAQYVADNERVVKTFDRSFPQYITAYAGQNRDVPYSLRSRMAREYQQRQNNPGKVNDPYRMACYKIMGRCDLSKLKLDVPRVEPEDLIWMYFALARESNRAEETAGETFGLDEVQSLITDIKERQFAQAGEGGSGYATCFFLQILAGMFEQAIAWLYPHDYVAAVHFAIALDFYGLLRVSDFTVSANELLTYTTREKPQISFGYMLGYYTRDFRLARAEAAADYLILLCLNEDLPGSAGRSQVDVCHESLKDLVLETREFALLLGDIRTDGHRIKGAIEARLPLFAKDVQEQQSFIRSLTIQAASLADDSGRITDAVLLYHLAEEYDNVIGVINRALSDALSVDIGSEPFRLQPLKPRAKPHEQQQAAQQHQGADRSSLSLTAVDDPVTLAQNMLNLYNRHALYFSKISQANRDAAGLLLRMSEVRDRIASQRWAEAIDTIILMDLLPMRAGGNIGLIRSQANNLNEQPPVVARNVGNLLVWAIGACGEQRRILRQGGWEVGTRGRETEQELRTIAKDLMIFAGLIRYRIAGDVYEMLARAGQDVDMF